MPRPFKILKVEDQDEFLANTLRAQETDLYLHETNKERYERMLLNIPVGTPWHDRIKKLKEEEESRIMEVQSILDALDTQLPSQSRIDAAMARIKVKEDKRLV